MAAEKVGVLGSGDVGKRLADGLARRGFELRIGSREPAKLAEWCDVVPGTIAPATFSEAARHGEFVILATSGAGTIPAIQLARPANFRGKLVIDATNPLDMSHGMPPGLFVGTTDSLGEQVQRALPDAHVVKCFNTVGNQQMIDPKFAAGIPPMMICGNDAKAKARVGELLKQLGWPGAMDVGGIDAARWLEALVPLWVRIGAQTNVWSHAFRTVT